MKYKIDSYCLDARNRTVTCGQDVQPVRPKTLALLVYLIDNQGAVVSKTQMLDAVWDDVNVNEGVIFQSIREIRQLFSNINVIQNVPRKGYQWIADVKPLCEAPPDTELASALNNQKTLTENAETKTAWHVSIRWLAFAIVAVLMVVSGLHLTTDTHEPVLHVKPLQSFIDRNDHHWLSRDGAAMLAADAVLKSTGSTASVEQPGKHDWVLDTAVYGDVYDYKLIYTLSGEDTSHKGVVFSHTIEQGIEVLAQVVKSLIDEPDHSEQSWPEATVAGDDFANAMTVYETDWNTAIVYLRQYLAQAAITAQETSSGARRASVYLSRLLVWEGHNAEAIQLTSRFLEQSSLPQNIKADLLFNLGLVYQHDDPKRALDIIEQALPIATAQTMWLTRAKLEELRADIFYQQQQTVEALRGYLKAASFYEQIRLPVNAAGLKLKLATVYIVQGDMDIAQQHFRQARTMITEKEMSFLYAALKEFELQHPQLL